MFRLKASKPSAPPSYHSTPADGSPPYHTGPPLSEDGHGEFSYGHPPPAAAPLYHTSMLTMSTNSERAPAAEFSPEYTAEGHGEGRDERHSEGAERVVAPPPDKATPKEVLAWCREWITALNITPPKNWRRIRFDLPDSVPELHLDPPTPEEIVTPHRPSACIILSLEDREQEKPVKEYTYDMIEYLLNLMEYHESTATITQLKIVKKGTQKLQQLVVTFGKDVGMATKVLESLREFGFLVGYGKPCPPLEVENPKATFQVMDFLQTMHASTATAEEREADEDPPPPTSRSSSGITAEDLHFLFAPYRPTKTVDVNVIAGYEPGVFYAPVKRPETVLSFFFNTQCSFLIQSTLFKRFGALVVIASCPHDYLVKGVPYHIQKKQRQEMEQQRRLEELQRRGGVAPSGTPAPSALRASHADGALHAAQAEQAILESDSEEDELFASVSHTRGGRVPQWAQEVGRSVDIFASVLKTPAARSGNALSPHNPDELLHLALAEEDDDDDDENDDNDDNEEREVVVAQDDRTATPLSSRLSQGPVPRRTPPPPPPFSEGAGGLPPPPQYTAVVTGPPPPSLWSTGRPMLMESSGGPNAWMAPPPPAIPAELRQKALKSVLVEEEDDDEAEGEGDSRSRAAEKPHTKSHRGRAGGHATEEPPHAPPPPRSPPHASSPPPPHRGSSSGAGGPHGSLFGPASGGISPRMGGVLSSSSIYTSGYVEGNADGLWGANPASAAPLGGGSILGAAPPSPLNAAVGGGGGSVLGAGGGLLPTSSTSVLPGGGYTMLSATTAASPPQQEQFSAHCTAPPPANALTGEEAEALVKELTEALAEVFQQHPSGVWESRSTAWKGLAESVMTTSGSGIRRKIPSDASCWLQSVETTAFVPPLDDASSAVATGMRRFLSQCDEQCAAIQSLLLLHVSEDEEQEETEQERLKAARQQLVELLMMAPETPDLDWKVIPAAGSVVENEEENASKAKDALLPAVLPYLLLQPHMQISSSGGDPLSCQFGTTILLQWVRSLLSEVPRHRLELPAADRARETAAVAALLTRFLPPRLFRLPSVELIDVCAASFKAFQELQSPNQQAATSSSIPPTESVATAVVFSNAPHPMVTHLLAHWPTLLEWLQEFVKEMTHQEEDSRTLRWSSTVCNALDRLLAAISPEDRQACRLYSLEQKLFDVFFHPPAPAAGSEEESEAKENEKDLTKHTSRQPISPWCMSPALATRLWDPKFTLPLSVLRLYLNADVLEGMPLALALLSTPSDSSSSNPAPQGVTRDHFRFFLAALSKSYVSPVLSRETAIFSGVFLRALEVQVNRFKAETSQRNHTGAESPHAAVLNTADSMVVGEAEERFFLDAAIRALPPSNALPIYLAMRQSYFELEVSRRLCGCWGLLPSASEEPSHTSPISTAEEKTKVVPPASSADSKEAATVPKVVFRQAQLEERLPVVQALLNARKVPTIAAVQQALFPPPPSVSTALVAAGTLPKWDPAWTEIMAKYPKVGFPFAKPLPPNYTAELSRSYGFYYYKPKAVSKVHASPTYKHPATGEEYMATPQAFLREPSVTTTLKDLVQYACTHFADHSASHKSHPPNATAVNIPMKEAEAWFHDQRIRHPLLDAAVLSKFKITYKLRSSSSTTGKRDEYKSSKSSIDPESTSKSGGSSATLPPLNARDIAPYSNNNNSSTSAAPWRRGEAIAEAVLVRLLKVTESYPESAVEMPFPNPPRGWTIHPSTINGLYMFRNAANTLSAQSARIGSGFHTHPTTRKVYRVTPQALAKNRRVNPAKLHEVALQVQQESSASSAHVLDTAAEERWWKDQRFRHPALDRALIRLLKVDYEYGEELQQRYSSKYKRPREGDSSKDAGDRASSHSSDSSSDESEHSEEDSRSRRFRDHTDRGRRRRFSRRHSRDGTDRVAEPPSGDAHHRNRRGSDNVAGRRAGGGSSHHHADDGEGRRGSGADGRGFGARRGRGGHYRR